MKKLKNIKKLISPSPIIDLEYEFENSVYHAYVLCGWYSLTGSIKDRVAYQIFQDAIKNKLIHKNTKIVEVSSGNMGISVCAIANLLGLKTTIIMPITMSEERKQLIKLYGAELILTEDFKSAFSLLEDYKKKGYFCPQQFENPSNTKAHYNLTGKQLFSKIKNKKVINFISGIGTAGTLIGAGKFLKEQLNLILVAIEPKSAPILTKSAPLKKHSLQGFADEIVPKIYDEKIVDSIIQIDDNDAIAMSRKLSEKISFGVGISSGANFLGCVLSKQNCATVFADSNKKYLSTNLTQNVQSELVDKIKLINVTVL